MSDDKPYIVLIEDNAAEARLIEEILGHAPGSMSVLTFATAIEALSYLQWDETSQPRRLPSLILLDLNLPEMDGRECLKILKSDGRLKRIPVVILTGSESEDDICTAYRHCANGYVTKPTGLDALREVVRGIESFWLSTVTLPPH